MTPLLHLASAPALPLHTAGPYVAAAYIVFLAVVLIYVGIMARRLIRNQREIAELRQEIEARDAVEGRRDSGGSSADAGLPEFDEREAVPPR